MPAAFFVVRATVTDPATRDHALEGGELNRLIADFNRDWPDVTRTRELLVLAEEFVPA